MLMQFPAPAYLLFVPCVFFGAGLLLQWIHFYVTSSRSQIFGHDSIYAFLFAFLFFFVSSLFLVVDTELYDLPDPVFFYVLLVLMGTYIFGRSHGIFWFVLSVVVCEYYLFAPNYTLPLTLSSLYIVPGGIAAVYIGNILRDRARQLAQLNKQLQDIASAKDRMSHIIAHDIRNSLALIKIQTDLLLRGSQAPELLSINEENFKLSAVVDSILTLAKAEKDEGVLEKEEFSVQKYFEGKLAIFKKIYADHRFSYTHSGSATAKANRDIVDRIINNLVDNAAKYSGKNTIIGLATSCSSKELIMSVSDQGIGIKNDLMQTLLRPYTQADAHSKGVGLGLYIVKSLTELHHGSMTIDSTPGRGSTFTITLPR